MTVFPQCFNCKHFHNNRAMTCAAFPDGIPEPILVAEHDHRKPYPGDHDIRFEPIAATPPEPDQ